MEKGRNHSEYIAHLLEMLSDEKMSVIDFDHLREWLAGVAEEMSLQQDTKKQLELLRDDYSQRIGGMVKAMAALDRKKDSWQEALSQVESLSSMGARELAECYRMVSARFRDCFPTSFGLLRETRRKSSGTTDPDVYK